MPEGLIGRGDLLRALLQHGGELPAQALEALGYVPEPAAAAHSPVIEDLRGPSVPPTDSPQPAPVSPPAPASFWQAVRLVPDEIEHPGDGPSGVVPTALPVRAPGRPSDYRYLTSFAELVPRLRNALSEHRPSRTYDIPRIVSRIGRGENLRRLPRRRRAGWGANLYVIEDRCNHLAPYVRDQAMVQLHLRRLYPTGGFHQAIYSETHPRPRVFWPDGRVTDIAPLPGDQVLVLGDLGCLARDGGRAARFWAGFGEELGILGASPFALLPCATADCLSDVAVHYRLLTWEHPAPKVLAGAELHRRGERLLTHLSIASRIEPRLLREIRLGLGAERFSARLEAWAWQHPAMGGADMLVTALAGHEAEARRIRFRCQPERGLGSASLRAAREAMRHLPYEIWLETVLNFADWDREAISPGERRDALDLLSYLAARVGTPGEGPLRPRERDWLEDFYQRLGKEVKEASASKHACWVLAGALVREGGPLPLPREPLRVCLYQRGGQLQLGRQPGGSPLAELRSRDGLIQWRPRTDPERDAFWEGGAAPSWATDWGWDEHGAWVAFSVKGRDGAPLVQRMRWIEPGRFLMGSPVDEPGRRNAEGPQHEVTIAEGYWLFDTACTQGLWEAVMGDNPARFKGARRPVERGSWDGAQRFLATLNARVPGLGLSLPSEAQWEYGCRAGTETPFSFGSNVTPAEMNYNGNHPYAGAAKGEYRQETVPVGSLPANPWGLYEMHGNVWEWVQDAWHDNYQSGPTDGFAWESDAPGANRVIRGGSWLRGARRCRSAYRFGYQPGIRYSFLGFRCARAQVREPEQAGGSGASGPAAVQPAERIRPGGGGAGSRSGEAGRDSGSAHPAGMPDSGAMDGARAGGGGGGPSPEHPAGSIILRLDAAARAAVQLPTARVVEVRTDRERLTLRQMERPGWASAMGRDRFGLWAEISVEREGVDPVVQRLRWIPPGRFTMGSSPDEPGRWDPEGPQHEVVLGDGYWLFDTPCTQAFWEALMGSNPSEFSTPDRPVEGVSWSDAQGFLDALNRRLADPDGAFVLPSEAQWEYACRAGTETALYAGPIEMLGDADAPALDPIAWYGGNSGVGFELANGWERILLREMQHPEGKAGTHSVKGKKPNPWGLYDMLGNVWEWTQDVWHNSYEDAPLDGSAWESDAAGADRVVRGGSWFNVARLCRSAGRLGNRPGNRDYDLGFRCARARVRESSR